MLFLTLFFTELQHYFVVLQVFSRVTFMVDIKIMLLNTTKKPDSSFVDVEHSVSNISEH